MPLVGTKTPSNMASIPAWSQTPPTPFVPSSSGPLQPDILLYRTLLARITAGIAKDETTPASFSDNLAILHLVCIAVARINSLWRTNKRLSRDGVQPLLSAFKSFGFTDEELNPKFSLPLRAVEAVRHPIPTASWMASMPPHSAPWKPVNLPTKRTRLFRVNLICFGFSFSGPPTP